MTVFPYYRRMPVGLSSSVRHLIASMLVVNPDDRYTIEQVASHPWVNETYQVGAVTAKSELRLSDKPRVSADPSDVGSCDGT